MLKTATFMAALSMAIASQMQAATVTYTLYVSRNVPNGPIVPGAFVVTAKVSAGDNGGLSGYGMDLLGGILTLDHKSPRDPSADTATQSGPTGFTLGRSADNVPFIVGSQDITYPDVILVYGMGFEDSSFALKGITVGGATLEQPDWDAELILATGTYTVGGALPRWNRNGPNRGANVFVNSTGLAVRQPELLQFFPEPEPTSAVLIGLGLLTLTVFRRRAA